MATTMTAYEFATRTGRTIEEAAKFLHRTDVAGATVTLNTDPVTVGGEQLYDVDDALLPYA